MKMVDYIIGAILGVAALNVVFNARNTASVISAVGSNSNTILATLVKPG